MWWTTIKEVATDLIAFVALCGIGATILFWLVGFGIVQ